MQQRVVGDLLDGVQPISGCLRLYTSPPAAMASSWAPRQMPQTGPPSWTMRRMSLISSARNGYSSVCVACMAPPRLIRPDGLAGPRGQLVAPGRRGRR